MRSENGWTIDLQPHIVTTATHDDDDTAVVADEETYETHYGLRDPMLDVLRRSYLHAWTMKGAHARFVTYAEHTAKCKAATILKWSSATFYRWKQKEEENYAKSPDKDEQLPQEARPIRHESQVHGLLRTIKEDREFAKSTNPKEEPFMKDARTGRQHNFDPLWYPQLISMAEESLDSMGFGPETIAICATQIFSEKLSLPAEEASFYTPSDRWCYWFMRQKMGLSMRKQCTSPLSPEARIKQDQLHQITLQRIALLLDEGLKPKYVIGSDEFGMLLFPQGQYRWAKIGSKEVKGTVKEDRRQYTGDIAHNMDGDVVGVHQIWGGKCSSSLPDTKVQQKYPSIKFSVSPNHWANLTTKIEFAKFIWNWVVEEHMKDSEKEGKELSREQAEATARCVWILDCW